MQSVVTFVQFRNEYGIFKISAQVTSPLICIDGPSTQIESVSSHKTSLVSYIFLSVIWKIQFNIWKKNNCGTRCSKRTYSQSQLCFRYFTFITNSGIKITVLKCLLRDMETKSSPQGTQPGRQAGLRADKLLISQGRRVSATPTLPAPPQP